MAEDDNDIIVLLIGYMGESFNEQGQSTGVKGVGKDTCADLVFSMAKRLGEEKVKTLHISFAGPMKNILADFYDLDRSVWDVPSRKETEMKHLYPGWSWRKKLECYGTDVIRDGVGQMLPELKISTRDLWVNKVCYRVMRAQLKPEEALVASTFDLSNQELFETDRNHIIERLGVSFNQLRDAVLSKMQETNMYTKTRRKKTIIQCTDLRFYNEWEAFKSLGGLVVKVTRCLPGSKPPNHASNCVDERMIPDMVVENDGSVEDLTSKIMNSQIGKLLHLQ